MAYTALRPGGTDWLPVFAAWLVLTGVVYLATDLGIVGSVLGMVGLYFVSRGVLAVWKAVESRSIERTAIGSLAGSDGAVAVEGAARPVGGPLAAPMSGAETVAYRTRVIQETSGGGEEGGGKSIRYTDDGYGPFVVDDGTGTAYVDPDGAEVLLTTDDEVTVPGGEEPPPRVREFVERETDLDPVCDRKREYEESRIDVGETVYVAGRPDPDGGTQTDRSVTAAITDGADVPRFYVSDDPDHGLGRRLLGEALASFVAAAMLLGITYFGFWP